MSTRLNGSSMFMQAISGLTGNFNYLSQGEDLTLDKLKNPDENVNKNFVNSQFQSYLITNFSKLDKNADGILGAEELQDYTNALANKGMTLEEITQLCYQNGQTNSLLETVMANFNEIDKNHDGKVTNDEIKAYGIDEDIQKMKDEFPKFNANAMSIFYSPSSEATEES